MTIAITARLFLNGSWLKDIIIRNDVGEVVIEVPSKLPTRRYAGYCVPFLPEIIQFKQSFYNINIFSAVGISKQSEALLRVAEKKKIN